MSRKNNVFYVKNTSALTILKQKGAKNVIKFAKDIEMILKFDRSYPKRQWEFHASVQYFMSTVEYEGYGMVILKS